MKGTTLAFVIGVLLLSIACKEPEDEPSRPDAGPTPDMLVAFHRPFHFQSSVAPDVHPEVEVVPYSVGPHDAYEYLKETLIVETYPDGAAVPGAWNAELRGSGSFSAKYEPDDVLKEGDYLIRPLRKDDIASFAPVPVLLFHVGSILRVSKIELLPLKDPDNLVFQRISVQFSEPVKEGTATIEVQNGQWLKLADVPVPTLEPETLPTPVDVAKTLRVTITAETDDGKKVDGKYTGKHDSGRLVAEFVPETLQRGDSIEWYPPLTIDRQ